MGARRELAGHAAAHAAQALGGAGVAGAELEDLAEPLHGFLSVAVLFGGVGEAHQGPDGVVGAVVGDGEVTLFEQRGLVERVEGERELQAVAGVVAQLVLE